MAEYERLDDAGTVVERVITVDGSIEDTRIGVAVLEGRGWWRVAGRPEPPPPAPSAPAGQGAATDPAAPAASPSPRTTKARRRP